MKSKLLPVILLSIFLSTGLSAANFSPLVQADPASKLWLEARDSFHATWFEKADGEFKQLLEQKPNFALGYAYLSAIDMLLYRDTTKNTTTAIELLGEQSSAETNMVWAVIAFARGELDLALKFIDKFLEEYPNDPYALHMKGFLLYDVKKYRESVGLLSLTLNKHPEASFAHNHLGYGLLKLERFMEAESSHRKLIIAYPNNPSVHDSYAETLAQQGKLAEAIVQLKKGLAMDDRFAYGWKHLAELHQQAEQPGLAKAAYENALQSSGLYGQSFKDMIKKRLAEF